MTRFDIVIVRSNMLAEVWSASLLQKQNVVTEVMYTSEQTRLTPEQLETIRNMNVLIIGGYYHASLAEINMVVSNLTSILQDSPVGYDSANVLLGDICACVLDLCGLTQNAYASRIAVMLDGYLAGEFSDTNLNFQAGVYGLSDTNHVDRVTRLAECVNLNLIIEAGIGLRKPLKCTAAARAKTSVAISYGDISIQCAAGDSPIVESCIALAELSPNGIGMLVRHNYKVNRTMISLYSNDSINVANIAAKLVNGGGSAYMAGGSCEGLLTAHQIIASGSA